MGCGKIILCIIFPPLAVLDRGCQAILITFVLTLIGWIPGVIAAILYNNRPKEVVVIHKVEEQRNR